VTTLAQMTTDIELYTTYSDADFIAEIPRFIQSAEERIFFIVQLPANKVAKTGNMTAGNPYLQLPNDFLAPASLSLLNVDSDVDAFLLNKDVEYIRQVFPDPTDTGVPFCYAWFNVDVDTPTIIIGPTPDLSYDVQLNYYAKQASLVDVPTGTWLSINAYDTLLYGALSESANYLKRNAGIDNMGDVYEGRFVAGLAALKNLGESRDRKDTYRSGEKRKAEVA